MGGIRPSVLGFLAALALLMAGCGSPAGDSWPGRDLSETDPPWRSEALAPGGGFELDHPVQAGHDLAWDWFVEERLPAHFTLHSHQGNAVATHVDESATDGRGSFRAPTTNYYSLLWVNEGSVPLTLWHRSPEGALRTTFSAPP